MRSDIDKLLRREPLSRDFYADDPVEVARRMLGSVLIHRHPERGWMLGRVVETEAYRGEEDRACHASAGRTARASTLFGPPGYAYVYLIYGMYHMLNAVSWPEGMPGAVLIRAIEPVFGIERTTDGPGKLTRALGIDLTLNRADLTGSRLSFVPDKTIREARIETSRRIGVEYAGEWARKPWRFTLRDNPFVSRRPSPARRSRRGA